MPEVSQDVYGLLRRASSHRGLTRQNFLTLKGICDVLSLERPAKPETPLDHSIHALRPILDEVLNRPGAQFILQPEALVHLAFMARYGVRMMRDPSAQAFLEIFARSGLTPEGAEDLYARADEMIREYARANGVTLDPEIWS